MEIVMEGQGQGQGLARPHPLDTHISVLAQQGLDSAGHGGETGLVRTTMALVGCWKKGSVWKESEKKGRNF